MNIYKKNNKLVLELDLFQKSYDAIGEEIGSVPNLIGISAGQDYSISQLCDLGYKGTQQEGCPIIMFTTKEELEEECKKLGLDIWELPVCAYCKKAIRDSFTAGDKGDQCFDCEWKEKECTNCHKEEKGELSDWCTSCLETQ